jgi:hypothetical protein
MQKERAQCSCLYEVTADRTYIKSAGDEAIAKFLRGKQR